MASKFRGTPGKGLSSVAPLAILAGILSFTQVACTPKGVSLTAAPSQDSGPDFMKSEILPGPTVPADGVSQLLVAIRLLNSDSTPVVGFRPDYSIVSGGGVIKSDCTASDANGVAVCMLRANAPGEKRLRVTNISTKTLEGSINFSELKTGKTFTALTIGGGFNTHGPGGWKADASLGSAVMGAQAKGSGYTVHGGVIGILNSEPANQN